MRTARHYWCARLGASPGEDLGRVGEVDHVNVDPVLSILDQGRIPVVASIGLGYDGEGYNVNADTVAAELAVALRATKLILLTDVDGVHDRDGTLLTELDRERAAALVAEGVISGGMMPKVRAALRALDGVEATHIIDGACRTPCSSSCSPRRGWAPCSDPGWRPQRCELARSPQ